MLFVRCKELALRESWTRSGLRGFPQTQVFLDAYRDIITSFSLVVNVILLTRMAKHFCHSGTKHEEKEEKGTLLWKRSPAKAF